MAKLTAQQLHQLWVNTQAADTYYHPPIHFVSRDGARELYVYSRDDSGFGEALSLSDVDLSEYQKADIDALIKEMEIDLEDPLGREVLAQMEEAGYDTKNLPALDWWMHKWFLKGLYFKKLVAAHAPDFSKIYGVSAAAEAAHQFLSKVAGWGKGKYFGGDNVLLRNGRESDLGPNEWEVMWEDGPEAWADHTSLGRMLPSDSMDGLKGVLLMNVNNGPDWHTEANFRFSLVFRPRQIKQPF